MTFQSTGTQTGNLRMFQWDYGVPVNFLAGAEQGFQIGEKIIFVFETEAINDKEFTVNAEDFSLSLKLEKSESDALYAEAVNGYNKIAFSAKRYSAAGAFLETVLNGYLYTEETVEWQN